MGRAVKSRSMVVGRISCLAKRSLYSRVACLKRPSLRRSLNNGKAENWDQIAPSFFPRARGTTQKIGRKKRVRRKELYNSVNLKNAIRVRQSLGIGHFRKPRNKSDAPAEKHGIWLKKCLQDQYKGQGHVLLSHRSMCNAGTLFENPEAREFAVALMHILSKKGPSSAELDTLRKSRNPTAVITAKGEVSTSEEAQVCVHDLELFVTV